MNTFDDTWPEDEAYAFASDIGEYIQDGTEPEYIQLKIEREVEHWRKVFDNESDLIRFVDEYNRIMSITKGGSQYVTPKTKLKEFYGV